MWIANNRISSTAMVWDNSTPFRESRQQLSRCACEQFLEVSSYLVMPRLQQLCADMRELNPDLIPPGVVSPSAQGFPRRHHEPRWCSAAAKRARHEAQNGPRCAGAVSTGTRLGSSNEGLGDMSITLALQLCPSAKFTGMVCTTMSELDCCNVLSRTATIAPPGLSLIQAVSRGTA